MSTTREEIELALKDLDLREAYIAAKEKHGRDSDESKAAKAALNEHRRPWREIRDYFTALGKIEVADGDGVASPATVRATAKAQKG